MSLNIAGLVTIKSLKTFIQDIGQLSSSLIMRFEWIIINGYLYSGLFYNSFTTGFVGMAMYIDDVTGSTVWLECNLITIQIA